MKFVCRKCETFMAFSELEGIREDSVGVTFGCSGCGARISMVTNAGETQMVKALGVQLGGRQDSPAPLELTRATLQAASPLAEDHAPRSRAVEPILGSTAESLKKSMGKCPFANMMSEMPVKTEAARADAGPVSWTPEAKERLERVPDFVRGFAKTMIEDMARQDGSSVVNDALMDAAKTKFM